jgi:hypothetical protein
MKAIKWFFTIVIIVILLMVYFDTQGKTNVDWPVEFGHAVSQTVKFIIFLVKKLFSQFTT